MLGNELGTQDTKLIKNLQRILNLVRDADRQRYIIIQDVWLGAAGTQK